jgi:hypothetical protein
MLNDSKGGDTAVVITWSGLFLSYLTDINLVLQTLILILAFISGCFAVYWHAVKFGWIKRKGYDAEKSDRN